MKKKIFIGFAAAVAMIGLAGCTYNDVYYNSQTQNTHIHPKREPLPIMFAHPGYSQTYCNPPASAYMVPVPRRPHIAPIDASRCAPLPPPKVNPHICPTCGREFIPPYHQNHVCPYRHPDRNRWW